MMPATSLCWRNGSLSLVSLDPTLLLALRQSGLPGLSRTTSCCFSSSLSYQKSWKTQHRYVSSNRFKFNPKSLLLQRYQKYSQDSSVSSTSVQLSASKEKSSVTEEPKRKMSASEFKRLLSLAAPEKCTLASAIGLLAVSSSITMAVPFALGHVIDIIYTADTTLMKDNLDRVTMILSAVFLTGAVANFGRVYLMNIAGQRITRTMRSNVFSSIMSQEIAFFDTNKTGELVNRLSADTSLVSQTVTMNISDGLRSTIMAVAGVGMMFYMSPELAIVGLAIVPPTAFAAIFYGRYVKNITKKVQDTLADATQVAEERIANVRTVRAFAQEPREVGTYNQSINEVLKMTYKESLARGVFFGMTGLSGNIIILSVLYYGGKLVMESSLSVGQLSSFLLYSAYVGIALGGISTFYSEMNRGLGASTRLFNLIDRVPGMPTTGGLTISENSMIGNISFENISFAYPTRPDVQIFKNFSLSVLAGSNVAVVGSSGSGKSTLGSLLLRLYDPAGGQITLDGIPVTQIDPAWLRFNVASVSQEPVLFSSSIRENLLYGARNPESITEDQLQNAAQEANAWTFIQGFPEGLNTLVGERGVMLSGGQKQRIAIARALISNPRILLLDEATSALDAESESQVQEALERLTIGRTVITIAHRLSTIRSSNQIAVLHEGQVAELGTYQDLMQIQDGLFRKLVEKQTITS